MGQESVDAGCPTPTPWAINQSCWMILCPFPTTPEPLLWAWSLVMEEGEGWEGMTWAGEVGPPVLGSPGMHSGEGLGGSSPKRPRVPWTGGGGGAAASTSSLGRSRCFVVHEVPSTPVAPWDLQNLPLRTVGQGLSPHPSQEGAEPQRSRGSGWGRGSLGAGLWVWGCPCTVAPTPSPWSLQTRAQHCLSLCCPLDVRLLNSTSCPHFIQDPMLLTLAGSLLAQPQLPLGDCTELLAGLPASRLVSAAWSPLSPLGDPPET